MKRMLFVFFALALFFIAGCVESVRYSPDEIKTYPASIQENIKRGEVVPGMTMQQVRYAWGAPAVVNVLQASAQGKYREEWVYSKMGIFKTRLIFVDGTLMHILSNDPGVITNNN